MNIVKHDPFKDRFPLGGIKTNQHFTINIYIQENEQPYDCNLLIRNDETGEVKSYPMTEKTLEQEYKQFTISVNINEVGLFYYFFSYCSNNRCLYIGKGEKGATVGSFLPQWQLTIYDENFTTPDWIKGGIIYQIFPDRFNKAQIDIPKTKQERKIVTDWNSTPEFIYDNPNYKANDFFMGNLKGITQKLEYLKELNVTAIYLNPIFESAENHRYSTADYMNIDPYLGNKDDFNNLSNQCKKYGIKLLLDGVFSHTGADSIYFNRYNNYDSVGAYNSPSSPYFSWYKFQDYPQKYECWWNFANLPNVNEEDPNYLDFITNKETGILEYWLNQGASGYRLDVIDEIPDVFLDKLRETVKANNPENLIIGEVWEDATTKEAYGKRRRYLLGKQMDCVMNYPWKEAIIALVKTKDVNRFYNSVMNIIANYPPEVLSCLMNILSSHDTKRIITELGETRTISPEKQGLIFLDPLMKIQAISLLKLATFLQFTLPGVPSIYYADEAGLEGFKDPYCRRTYPWGNENFEILNFYKTLTKIRNQNKLDFAGDFEFVHQGESSLAYRRNHCYCLVNLDDKSSYIDLVLDGNLIYSDGDIAISPLGIILGAKSTHIIRINKE